MEELYDILPKTYENTLRLLKRFDEKLYQKATKHILNLPKGVLNKIKQHKEFDCEGVDFKTFFEIFENQLEFQHTRYGKYFNINMTVNAFTKDELLDDNENEEKLELQEETNDMDYEEFIADHPEYKDEEIGEKSILLFSLTTTNCEEIPTTYYNYLQKGDEYTLQGVNFKGMEFDFAVFLEKYGEDEYYLIKEVRLNDDLVLSKKEEISYEELLDYVCDDLGYEED